jgi:hypothetical protein
MSIEESGETFDKKYSAMTTDTQLRTRIHNDDKSFSKYTTNSNGKENEETEIEFPNQEVPIQEPEPVNYSMSEDKSVNQLTES